MTDALRIGVLEDDREMRDYLEYIINRTEGMEICFSSGKLGCARSKILQGANPDICLVDLQLPDGNGIDFIKETAEAGDSKFLVLTVLGDRVSVLSALEAGAHGYLLKDSDERMVIKSLRQTMDGANPISPEAATHLLSVLNKTAPVNAAPSPSELSERQADVLTCFAKGLSYQETAEALNLSVHTINDHVKTIYGKLRVHSKSEAVFEALQLGWIRM
jgi:DNA-binding NarL/FixJ family response regulator